MKSKILILLAFCGILFSFTHNFTKNPSDSVAAQNLFPLEIKSIASQTKSGNKTLVLMTAKNYNTTPQTCGIKFTLQNGKYVGTMVPLTAASTPSDFTIQIDTMQGFTADSTIQLLIPTLQSGRAMVSINNILCMSTIPDETGFVFQDPNINNPGDPSYNILFDKFEFTYTQSGDFYINPTAVDFYAIPIHLNTLNDSLHSGSPLGISRDVLIDSIKNVITKGDLTTNHDWNKCIIKDNTGTNLLRIASPSLAPGFDTTYLSDTSPSSFDYITNISSYYQGKTLIIDCTQLDTTGFEVFDSVQMSPSQDPGAYYFTGTMVTRGNRFVFTNNPSTKPPWSHTIFMNKVTSEDFFKPGTGQFATPNKTVQSIISENITSGFSVGLFPADNQDTFSNHIFPTLMSSYFMPNANNGRSAVGNGPWFNLYSQAIHNILGNSIYAFAFDDVLGMDGTLVTTKKVGILVTIGDLGNITVPVQTCEPDVITIDASTIKVSQMNCGKDSCTITVTWNVPLSQPSNAKYFIQFNGGKFIIPTDSIAFSQVNPGPLPGFKSTSATLCFNKSDWLGSFSGTDIGMQVFTCGSNTAPCPTAANVSIWNKCQGSLVVQQSGAKVNPNGCNL